MTARRSPPAGRRPWGSRSTPNQQISPLHLVQGTPPTTSNDVVMDLGTAQKYGFKVGEQVRILLAGPDRRRSPSRASPRSGRPTTWPGRRWPRSTCRRRRRSSARWASSTPSTSSPTPGADKAHGATRHRRGAPARRRGGDRSDRDQRADERHQPGAGLLQHGAARVRLHRAVRRRRSPSSTRSPSSWASARGSWRCCASSGASRRQVFRSVLGEAAIVGLVSSLIGLGLGVLAAIGLEALLSGLRRHPAFGPARLRGPDGHRLPRRGGGGDRGRRPSARLAGPCASHRSPPSPTSRSRTTISLRRRFTWGAAITLAGVAALWRSD